MTLSDLVVESICWKKEACGFKMIQLQFRRGITSPWFLASSNHLPGELTQDEINEEANSVDFQTTPLKQGKGDKIACVRVRVAQDKYVERLMFLDRVIPAEDKDIKRSHESVIGVVEPCRCGEDVNFEIDVKNGYRIVGLYGLTATDKWAWVGEKIRSLNNIRSLGFITMKIDV